MITKTKVILFLVDLFLIFTYLLFYLCFCLSLFPSFCFICFPTCWLLALFLRFVLSVYCFSSCLFICSRLLLALFYILLFFLFCWFVFSLMFSFVCVSDPQSFVSVQRINMFLCCEDLDTNSVTYAADAGKLLGTWKCETYTCIVVCWHRVVNIAATIKKSRKLQLM